MCVARDEKVDAMYWLHGCCMSFVSGYSLGTKPCVFPCKVAPAGEERYLVCAAVAAGVVLMFFWFLFCVLQGVVRHFYVALCVS